METIKDSAWVSSNALVFWGEIAFCDHTRTNHITLFSHGNKFKLASRNSIGAYPLHKNSIFTWPV